MCVCMQWYMVSTYGSVCALQNSKLEKKANDITKGGVGRDKRDTASGARQLCVCVSSLAVSF